MNQGQLFVLTAVGVVLLALVYKPTSVESKMIPEVFSEVSKYSSLEIRSAPVRLMEGAKAVFYEAIHIPKLGEESSAKPVSVQEALDMARRGGIREEHLYTVMILTRCESDFRQRAVNGNAWGLMQIMHTLHEPKVRRLVGDKINLLSGPSNYAVAAALIEERRASGEGPFMDWIADEDTQLCYNSAKKTKAVRDELRRLGIGPT